MKIEEMDREELISDLCDGIHYSDEGLFGRAKTELLTRLAQGEGAEKEIQYLKDERERLLEYSKKCLDENIRLENELRDSRCCGNCSMADCDTERGNLDDNFGKYCDRWCSDGQTREARLIE
jgi:hypothetical protein